MNIACSGIDSNTAYIYVNDIKVVGHSVNNMLQNLEKVFKICQKFNLKLNPEKYEFFRHEVTFLGHTCTKDGIKPDEFKMEAIKNWPTP